MYTNKIDYSFEVVA